MHVSAGGGTRQRECVALDAHSERVTAALEGYVSGCAAADLWRRQPATHDIETAEIVCIGLRVYELRLRELKKGGYPFA